MTAEPLKPCPFCGGKAIIAEYDHHLKHHIYCDFCGAETPSGYSTPEKAIAAWNRRAEPFGNSEELPLWMKEIITEKLMPGSRPWNYETRVIMDTLEWVLSLNKPEKE